MKMLFQSGIFLLVMSLISGVLYPAIVSSIGQLLWPEKCNGSLIKKNDQIIGSALIAQEFKRPDYFWPRPSASNFNALPSGASNLGPTSVDLAKKIGSRLSDLSQLNSLEKSEIALDLVTSSASGLDPHISIKAARNQINRIAAARGFNEERKAKLEGLIDKLTEGPELWVLGEQRLNVLMLNLGLDKI
jgi:K+-transporting ATPase ATPase C chain